MNKLNLPSDLEDKIFEIRFESDKKTISKIVSYFPFSESEKSMILSVLGNDSFDGFYSIFTDVITAEEWDKTKEQIKKKFQDDLFDIDKMPKSS